MKAVVWKNYRNIIHSWQIMSSIWPEGVFSTLIKVEITKDIHLKMLKFLTFDVKNVLLFNQN